MFAWGYEKSSLPAFKLEHILFMSGNFAVKKQLWTSWALGSGVPFAFFSPQLSATMDSTVGRQDMVNPVPGSAALGGNGKWKPIQAKMPLTPAAQLLPIDGILEQQFILILNRVLL